MIPLLLSGQVNFSFTTSESASVKNLFFKPVGAGGNKPVMIVDKNGNTVFSENLGMKGWDWKVNLNNHITYYDRQASSWHVVDSLFNTIDTVFAQNGYTADNHDFLALPNGNYVLFCYDNQVFPMNDIVANGNPNAIVEGLVIQELNNDHEVIFEWKSWDHFNITDNTSIDLTSDVIAFIHTNAIDIDDDGHFLISSRNLNEITKIHRTSGNIIWRWGGSQNQFTFLNDYPFTAQHCIKSLGNNKYLLFDNGNYSSDYTGGPNISRAVEYELDLESMTATKTWEFIHPDSLFSPSISSVQRLENGNTLVNFGNLSLLDRGAVITEVTPANEIVFELELDPPGENGNNNIYCANKFDWFFDQSINGCSNTNACNYSVNVINNEMYCVFPGDSCETVVAEQIVSGVIDENCDCVSNNTSIILLSNGKKLLHQFDVMGKDDKQQSVQISIYDDGSFEKKYILK
tara:strand:- start:580 stop:1959 length:1380 start_codon:yes stop_codon:yes gene_type:complete